MTTSKQNIVIVGGGIWGLSTAYHLARSGHANVKVLERNPHVAGETTPQAAGLIGQIRSSKAMCGAIQYALKLLSTFRQETGYDPGLRQTGSLMVALTRQRMQVFEQQLRRARDNNVEAFFISPARMHHLAPALDLTRVAGGYFVPGDGYLDPGHYGRVLAAAAGDLGVRIEGNSPVTGLRIVHHRVVGVENAQGVVEADQAVLTAGPWTALMARHAGTSLALQPLRHQSARTVDCPGIPAHHPVVRFPDVSGYLRPDGNGYLYGVFEKQPRSMPVTALRADFSTAHLAPPVEALAEARRKLAPLCPVLDELPVAQYRQGITTFTPDGSYLLGPVAEVGGLWVASGCSAIGIAGAAAVGQWLAEWIRQGAAHPAPADFALGRFGPQGADPAWVQRESESCYSNYYDLQLPENS